MNTAVLEPMEGDALAVGLDEEPGRLVRISRRWQQKRNRNLVMAACITVSGKSSGEIPEHRSIDVAKTEEHRLFERSCECIERGNYHLAVALLNRVVRRNENSADAWFKLGFSYGELGRSQQATACFDRALKLQPTWVEAWNNRGFNRLRMRDFAGAILDLKRALEIDPRSAIASYNLGKAYLNSNIFDEAAIALESACEHEPTNETFHYWLGKCHIRLGDRKKAAQEFRRACEINPVFVQAWLQLFVRAKGFNEWPRSSSADNFPMPVEQPEASLPNMGRILRRESFVVSEREAKIVARWQRLWEVVQNPVAWIAVFIVAALLYILMGK